jgi:hypothetical protein
LLSYSHLDLEVVVLGLAGPLATDDLEELSAELKEASALRLGVQLDEASRDELAERPAGLGPGEGEDPEKGGFKVRLDRLQVVLRGGGAS